MSVSVYWFRITIQILRALVYTACTKHLQLSGGNDFYQTIFHINPMNFNLQVCLTK